MKKKYKVEIDCPSCANLIEEAVNNTEGVKSCVINFMSEKMTIEYEDNQDIDKLSKDIFKIAKKIEPDFDMEI